MSAIDSSSSYGAISERDFAACLNQLDCSSADYATRLVDQVLRAARSCKASDIHWQPTRDGIDIRWRLDGVLQHLGTVRRGDKTDPIARLKVLANLLTYRTDVPQEGRLQWPEDNVEMRISTFPSLHGERVAIRLFVNQPDLDRLAQLDFPTAVMQQLVTMLSHTSGAVVVAGPAGSGKTTSSYAMLREIVAMSGGGRNIVTLEDPIEAQVAGVSQSQIHDVSGFTFAAGLRSLLRQDPEVILVGEMRDRETVEIAFQAALTGQLVLSTFHADSACGALNRLRDIGLEPYILRSGLKGLLWQRLVRRLCECAVPSNAQSLASLPPSLGQGISTQRVPIGCTRCHGTGYHGRFPIVEWLPLDAIPQIASLSSSTASAQLETLAGEAGFTTRWDHAKMAIAAGITTPEEIRRVLGWESVPDLLRSS